MFHNYRSHLFPAWKALPEMSASNNEMQLSKPAKGLELLYLLVPRKFLLFVLWIRRKSHSLSKQVLFLYRRLAVELNYKLKRSNLEISHQTHSLLSLHLWCLSFVSLSHTTPGRLQVGSNWMLLIELYSWQLFFRKSRMPLYSYCHTQRKYRWSCSPCHRMDPCHWWSSMASDCRLSST